VNKRESERVTLEKNWKKLNEDKKNIILQQKEIKKKINNIDIKNRRKLSYIYTFGEEIANATTHAPMALACLCMLPFSAVWAYLHAPRDKIAITVGISIFIISIFMMFLASTLYHVMQDDTKHKRIFKILDHIFIYFAIAGSYTPIALYVIGGWQGIVIVVVQWLMVLFGIFYKSLARNSIPKLSLIIYLVMGWTIVFFFPPFLKNSNIILLSLIALGGLLYTIGSIFYAMKSFKYHHMVWHLFINLAAIAHFIGIVFYIY